MGITLECGTLCLSVEGRSVGVSSRVAPTICSLLRQLGRCNCYMDRRLLRNLNVMAMRRLTSVITIVRSMVKMRLG